MGYIKKMLRSKTVWAGLAQIVTALGMYFTGEQSAHELLFGASGVLMIVFRMISHNSIKEK